MSQIVRIAKSLNKYTNVVLFPQKVENANEMLRTIGLPKLDMKADKLKGTKVIERAKANQSSKKLVRSKRRKAVA
jgi:hypothetical protein